MSTVQVIDGLSEMIDRFSRAAVATGGYVEPEVADEISRRFAGAFVQNRRRWPVARRHVLVLAELSGHIAGLYARLEGSNRVRWSHAKRALSAAQAECGSGPRCPAERWIRGTKLD